MKTHQQVMDDAKVRYRHTYTTDTVLNFLNAVLKDLWKKVPRESLPSAIICDKSKIYPLPPGVKRRYIKAITYGKVGGKLKDLIPTDLGETVHDGYYILLENQIIIHEDEKSTDTFMLMIYYDKVVPILASMDNLDDPVDIDESYEEAVVVGLLEKVAAARKDIKMKNNFASDYAFLLGDFMLEAVDVDPDYPSCRDDLPRRARYNAGEEFRGWTRYGRSVED